jgi:hypothetical protein
LTVTAGLELFQTPKYYNVMLTVKEELKGEGDGPITLGTLAYLLNISIDQAKSLVDHGYLRVVVPNPDPSMMTVSRPKAEGLEWLKNMFQPFARQPLVKLDDIHRLMEKYRGAQYQSRKERERHNVRRVCQTYRIPIYKDEVFGELFSIEHLTTVAHHLGIYYNPARTNRAGMLAFLLNALPPTHRKPLKLFRYTQRLELEIKRIASLENPQRTIRALELYLAWRDARTVQECLTKLREIATEDSKHQPTKFARVVQDVKVAERRIERLRAAMLL